MTTQEQEGHILEENWTLLLQLLEENNSIKFQQLLFEHPDYIEMHCIADNGVSISFIFLIFVSCEFVLDNCWSCSLVANVLYFIWLQSKV